ncbi:MAG: dihydrolipoyl dehydrogenase [Candidatus Woykebacteria bacterium]
MPKEYDCLVIGAGSAGMVAAAQAAAMGAKTAITEKWKLGGDCPNRACIPTKALLHSAKLYKQFQQAEKYGITAENISFDWKKIQAWKDKVVAERGKYESEATLKSQGVDLFWGQTSFVSPTEVKVKDTSLKAKKIIITAGSQPAVFPIEGLDKVGYITSNEAVDLPELPKSIMIVGGGAVGIEFAQIFSRFDVDVTVFEAAPHIIPAADQETAETLGKFLAKQGIKFHVNAKVLKFEKVGETKKVVVDIGSGKTKEFSAEEVMMATGRRPDFDGLNIEAARVETTKKGIVVDDTLKTSISNIYAAGDITGVMQFTHMATYQAVYATYNALTTKEPQKVNYRVVPWVAFSDPEIAGVGMTERMLREKEIKYEKSIFEFKNLGKASTQAEYDGFVKLLVDEKNQILGGFIVGPEAGELVHQIVVAMAGNVSADALGRAIFAYPTWSEAVGSAAAQL